MSTERVIAALERYAPGAGRREGERAAPRCWTPAGAREDLPAALAAIDIALWDLAGPRAGRPVAALLTDVPAASVPVNATLSGARPRAGAPSRPRGPCRRGFTCLKLKVGVGDDAGRRGGGRGPRPARMPRCAWTRTAPGACEEAVRSDRRARSRGPRARRGAHARPARGPRGARARGGAGRDRRDRRASPVRWRRGSPTPCA